MQSAGYRTGLVGKWHLGVPDKFHPTKTGFDYFMGFRTGGNKVIRPTLEVNGKISRSMATPTISSPTTPYGL